VIQSAAVQPLAVKRAVTPNSPSVVMAAVDQLLSCRINSLSGKPDHTTELPSSGK